MTKENIIYAGSEKGFSSFNPDELNDEQNLSPVTITSFKKFNQESDVLKRQLKNGEITLSFSDDVFSFEFSLLDFKNPEEYNYAYKIDGLDKDWIYSGNNRTAAYSHLQPGNYTFSVKASNADGVWNVPATVKLVIVPPFWRTWWFISVSVLMFLASGIVYFKLRENRLKKSNIALENTVMERTKDLIDANENLKNEITERKKAEASIQYSKEQYKLLVENANEAIIVLQDEIVVYYNPSAVEMLCSDPEELFRKNFREFIYPDYSETFFTDYLNTLNGEPVNVIKELKLVKRKSEIIEVEMNSLLIEWIDKNAALIFFKDVTERKRAEKKTENALIKEKELNELRSRFISMASHEFKTPLTSINTSVELLEKYDKSLTEDKKINSLQRIKKNVGQMTRLLNDVLEIGKSDSGKLGIQKEKLEIGKFLKEMLEELEATIAARTQHIISSSLINTDRIVNADPKLIRQVVENLISNAIKYSDRNTEIYFAAEIKDGSMIIKVKDSGIGILPEDMKRLFEPFFRGYNHGNAAGTGLGLAIMKRAVDAHGGRIDVKSEVNKGTEFSVFIPV
ncbi:MAG: ATP-binding protein [Ignavibacteriota bacterium]